MAVVINKESGLAENVPDINPDLHAVPLTDPEGNPVTAEHGQMGELLQQGYKQPDQAQLKALLKHAKFSSTSEQVKTGLEGVASGATLGLSTGIERAVGVKPEDMLARKETNPTTHMIGQGVGFLAPALLAPGLGAAVEATAVHRIGSAATRAAIENMVFQGSDEVSKAFMSDPHQSVETALTDIGLAGVLGAGFGGALKGTHELWKAGPGVKLHGLLENLSDRSKNVPVEVQQQAGIRLAPELQAAFGDSPAANKAFQLLNESNSSAGARAQSSLTEFHAEVNRAVAETLGHTPESIGAVADRSNYEAGSAIQKELGSALDNISTPISKSYDAITNKFKAAALSEADKSDLAAKVAELANNEGWIKSPSGPQMKLANRVLEELPLQATAQDIRLYAQNIKAPFGSEQFRAAKLLGSVLDDARERVVERELSAGAPELANEYRTVKDQYKNLRNLMDELNDRTRLGKVHGPDSFIKELHAAEPEAILRKLNISNDVGLQKLLHDEFPQVAQQIREHELAKLIAKAPGKDGEALSAKKLLEKLDQLTPEHRSFILDSQAQTRLSAIQDLLDRVPKKMNNSGTAKTLDAMWGEMPGAATGMLSMMLGHSGISGYLLGKAAHLVGREVPDAVRMAMLKYMGSAGEVSSSGFKAAVQLAGAQLKGEKALAQNVKAIFGGSAKAMHADVDALAKQLDLVQDKPDKMLSVAGDLGHYMPEHGTALAQVAARNVVYLQQFKPSTAPLGPMDSKRVASKSEEAKYRQALEIAAQPLSILGAVKDGTVTTQQIQHLQAMYPSLYNKMQKQIGEEIISAVAQSKSLPYATKLAVATFMQQPLESSMVPQQLAANQMQFMAMPQKQSPQHRSPSASSMRGLEKMPGLSMTPQQSRVLNRTTRHN